MKLVGFVVLGIAVCITVYYLALWILDSYLPGFAGGGSSNLGVCFVLVLPVSLLLGSIVTGYLSYPVMNSRWGLIGIAPGLYMVLYFGTCLCPASVVSVSPIDGRMLSSGLLTLLYGLFLYSVSLAGVGLGYFLRSLSRRHRQAELPD
ncbi:MAG: hypothetical protein ACYS21_12845 [Planctomycetota bacterium]|jgi:hypothetical protein